MTTYSLTLTRDSALLLWELLQKAAVPAAAAEHMAPLYASVRGLIENTKDSVRGA